MTLTIPSGVVAESLYERLLPLQEGLSDSTNLPLLRYIETLGSVHDLVRYVTGDTDDYRGWAPLFDVELTPDEFLPYLAQFVGVRIPKGTPPDTAREMIRDPAGFGRTSRAAVLSAVRATLTGARYVGFVERRDDSFWKWLITTRTAETPDADATYRAILSQKRAGVIVTHVVTDMTLIDELVGDIDSQTGDIDSL